MHVRFKWNLLPRIMIIVHNFGVLTLYEKIKKVKHVKVIRCDIDIRIYANFEGSYCLYTIVTNSTIDLWMPVQHCVRDGRMQQEGGRNQLSRQCVNACHSLPYCSQVWPIVTMRLNCTNNNDHCSDAA